VGLANADRVEFRRRVEDFIGMQLCDTDLAKLSLPGHPALLLHDPTDREVPFTEAELLAAAWPTAALTPIEGVGHRRIMQSGTAIDRTVQSIGDDVATATAP
jgi:pimeloyl-ACP methyl ester carboxylesterase